MSSQSQRKVAKQDADRKVGLALDPAAWKNRFLTQAVDCAIRIALRREADARRTEAHGRHRSRFNRE